MGQAAIPIILSLAGAGVGAYNTSRTAKKQDRALAEGIRKQGEIQRQANTRLNDSLAFFDKSGPEEIQSDLASTYQQQARLNQSRALSGLTSEGDISDDAKAMAAQSGSSVMDYAGFLSDVFSRIDAPTEQRRREGFERSDLGDSLSVFGRESRGEDYLARLKAAGITRNPWLDILGTGLSAASGGLAAGKIGAAGSGLVAGSTLTPQQFYSASSAAPNLPGQYGQSGRAFGL